MILPFGLLLQLQLLPFLCLATVSTIAPFCERSLDGLSCSVPQNGQQSLLQAWTKSQKLHTITTQSAAQTTSGHRVFLDPGETIRNLKFYMPSHGETCQNTSFTKLVIENGTLQAFSDWLWVVPEDRFDKYIEHRLSCGASLVGSIEEADLCYPTCTGSAAPSLTSKTSWMPQLCFEVPLQKRASWKDCSSICLQPEADDKCSVEVPYLHGISWPQQHQDQHGINAPWEFNFERTSMLAFVGCTQRDSTGKRDAVLRAMQNESSRINAASPEKVLLAHTIYEDKVIDWYGYGRTAAFYQDTWGVYASANFSWQPHGDTETRRALYESVMFGSVPVIEAKSANRYRHLFNGKLWEDVALENVFVVIPEGKEADGPAILQLLTSMPVDEVDQRRSRLQQIASALQWGEGTPNGGDAFLMALSSLRSGAYWYGQR